MKLWTDEETTPFETPWRAATVEKVVDADTFDLEIELGFDVKVEARIRLLAEGMLTTPQNRLDDSVNAWETRGEEREDGLKAKARVMELFEMDTVARPSVRVYSRKAGSKGKYGRWLVICLIKRGSSWVSVGDVLVDEGHAVFAVY